MQYNSRSSILASVPSQSKTAPFNRSHHSPRPGNVTIWIALGLRTGYHCNRGDCGHGPKESMANKFPNSSQDKTADLLLAIDRKSTRLNSSHTVISYAVFC